MATRNFFQNEKLLFLAKVIKFSDHENTYNYIARANINFKIYIFLMVLRLMLETCGSYVLGTKTKLLIKPIFDLGLRSESIEF